MARRYDEAFRPFGLNNGQFSVLVAIAGSEPCGIQALGERLGMDRTTVTAALKPLQRRGLLDVAVAQEDQRGRAVRLTQEGSDLLVLAIPRWEELQADIANQLGGESMSQALRVQLSSME